MQDSHDSSAFAKRVKKHVIGKRHRFVAVSPLGFEDTLVWELSKILDASQGSESEAPHAIADGKVEFTAKITEAWKVVAYSRIANRVLMEIGSFKAENFGQLEKHTAEIPWELFLENRCSGLKLHATCKHSRLYHSDAVEERVQRILEEKFAIETGDAPKDGQSQATPQHLYINFLDDRCSLWLDLAGEELYKRGHDRFVAEAPLKETIAAAMILEAIRQNQGAPIVTIIDPMAGSGTFSLETAYMANGLIPGKCRDFALKHQPAFKEATWNYIVGEKQETTVDRECTTDDKCADGASQMSLHKPISIVTSDISERAIEIIQHNVHNSPLPEGSIIPKKRDFFSYKAEEFPDTALILLNPPYGKRLDVDAPALYAKIGQFLQGKIFENEQKSNIQVAILVPKNQCRERLLAACSAMNLRKNFSVIEKNTSHGGFSLSVFFIKKCNFAPLC